MIPVKNRAPADVQVTAEQLVRTARESQIDDEERISKLKISTRITDEEELKMHQGEKRREFEDKLRHTMVNVGAYIRYAKWEESQMEFRRVRNVYERALETSPREYRVWIKYAEFEMRHKFVNHARNILDRAVAILPRVNPLWYKYVYFEQALGEVEKARLLFERWTRWEPAEQVWSSYINFEVKNGEIVKARDVYERMCGCFPVVKSYVKYAHWEEKSGQLSLAREVFERAMTELGETERKKQSLFIAFARFEERCKEMERARAIYKQSLDMLPKNESRDLYDAFVVFERQHGDRTSIENVLAGKRRALFESQVSEDKYNYDTWFDFIKLEEAHAHAEVSAALMSMKARGEDAVNSDKLYANQLVVKARERVRDVYERAVACVPLSKKDKTLWKRYIYLWINYALFEELQVEDMDKTGEVYTRALDVIPHKYFTFSKIWIMTAEFYLRLKKLDQARKVLGQAIGRCPREKVFKAYVQLELQLGNVDRCRKLYEKYLGFAPQNCFIWQKYAELENSVGEKQRARAIYELAVKQPILDMPETLWKRYIDFEIGLNSKKSLGNAQILYERLLERTDHIKVWISFAKFEALNRGSPSDARNTFLKAYKKRKEEDTIEAKEDRALLLKAWLETEQKIGDSVEIKKVEAMQPRKVKKKRQLEDSTWEEYHDFLFPDDPKKGLKLLQAAQKWKQSKKQKTESSIKPEQQDENEIDLDDV